MRRVDPVPLPDLRDERGRPWFVWSPASVAAAPAEVVDLGCGRQLTACCRFWPQAHVVGLDSSPEMITAAQGLELVETPSPTCASGGPRGRSTCCSATRRPVGRPPRAALPRWSAGRARRLARLEVPATSTSRATRSGPSWREAAYASTPAGVRNPASHDRPLLRRAVVSAVSWTCGYRRTRRAHGVRPRVHPGVPAPGPVRRCALARLRTSSRRSSSAVWPRPTRSAPTAPCCCPFAVFVWSDREAHSSRSAARDGRDDARRSIREGLGLIEVLRGAGRPGGACSAGTTRPASSPRAARRVEEPFAPARKAHPAFPLPSRELLEEVVERLRRLGYDVDRGEGDTFPGYGRMHVNDAFGNRVELLS